MLLAAHGAVFIFRTENAGTIEILISECFMYLKKILKNPLQTLKLSGPSACQRAAAVGCFMAEGDLGAEADSHCSTAVPAPPRCSAPWHSDSKGRAVLCP